MATLAGIFAVTYSVRLVHGVFFDGPLGKAVPNKDAHEPAFGMRAPATFLAILCILVGLLPALLVENIVNSTTRASTQLPNFTGTHLALWHGFNLPLLMNSSVMAD
ncbi:putative monovalent cation/H+ antiporter subunit A [compost metagenome]